MKAGWVKKGAFAVGALSVLLAGCSGAMGGMDHSKMNMSNMESSEPPAASSAGATQTMTVQPAVLTGKTFDLTASVSNQEIAPGKTLPVWTFNNSVPGPQIRVKQGDTVTIRLQNELPEPVTIHWHGVPVPNAMDGIPGVTQNAVQPGQSFTYTFKADVPGTYWYHSHQNGVNQLDRGLYGSFIVEGANEPKANRDYTLMLDEWISSGKTMSDMEMSDMSGMDMSGMDMSSGSDSGASSSPMGSMAMGDNMSMYDLYTINGKSGSLVDTLPVKEGDKVRIRLINAGYMSHQIHLHGHAFRIASTDGQPINDPGVVKDNVVNIAPGERYDLEFAADNPGQWLIEDHSDNQAASGMRAKLVYEGAAAGSDASNASVKLAAVDLTQYGQAAKAAFTLDQPYSREFTMNLNTEMKNGSMVYTINGKTFPNTDPLPVKTGDTVKVRLVNQSPKDDHPMHLHGQFFQVLSKNGKPVEGSPILKDSLNVKPGEEYVIAFKADNPGNWMFHCHDLHHASAGMMTEVQYTDYQSDFVADPNAGNKPE